VVLLKDEHKPAPVKSSSVKSSSVKSYLESSMGGVTWSEAGLTSRCPLRVFFVQSATRNGKRIDQGLEDLDIEIVSRHPSSAARSAVKMLAAHLCPDADDITLEITMGEKPVRADVMAASGKAASGKAASGKAASGTGDGANAYHYQARRTKVATASATFPWAVHIAAVPRDKRRSKIINLS
jgi:hypothetical protein